MLCRTRKWRRKRNRNNRTRRLDAGARAAFPKWGSAVLLMPRFLFFCEDFPLRPLPSLQRTQQKGIHRRDAETFEFLFDDGHQPYDARRTENECSLKHRWAAKKAECAEKTPGFFLCV